MQIWLQQLAHEYVVVKIADLSSYQFSANYRRDGSLRSIHSEIDLNDMVG